MLNKVIEKRSFMISLFHFLHIHNAYSRALTVFIMDGSCCVHRLLNVRYTAALAHVSTAHPHFR